MYRMSHRVPATFKLVYGHLNSIFLTRNFAWAFAIHFAKSGPKDFAKFQIFDPCTVCGKTLRDSGGGYLPAFWATLPYYLLFGPHHIITVIKNQWFHCWLEFDCQQWCSTTGGARMAGGSKGTRFGTTVTFLLKPSLLQAE